MIARLLKGLGVIVATVALVTISVANRHDVRMALDPFNPEMPEISLRLPFYAYLLAMLIVGVVLGGLATWVNQGKWRRLVRIRTHESLRWKSEAERLMRERDQSVVAERTERRKQVALIGR